MHTMSTPRLTGNDALSAWKKLTDDFESVERVAWKEGTTLFLSKNTTFVHKWQGEEDYELYEEDCFDLLMNEIGAAEAEIARAPIYALGEEESEGAPEESEASESEDVSEDAPNEQLTSYEAEAKPRWFFLYDHTEIDELGPNPRTLEIIVNQVLNI